MSDISRVDLKQLRVFKILLKERSVTRAASQMGMTQQAVSAQLSKLRDAFQDRLFIRSGQGVIPTPLAEQLEPRVNAVFESIDRLMAPDDFNPTTVEATYVISATDYAVAVVLPRLMMKLRKLAPGLKLIVRDFESDRLYALLASGDVDLALTFPAFVPESCQTQWLFSEHHVCVTRKDSPLLARPLTIGDVAGLPQLIVSPTRANLIGSADEWFASNGYKRNVVMSVPSFSAAPVCVASTDCIAFLPSRILPNPLVKEIELDQSPPCFDVIAAWHSRSSQDPLHSWILTLLQQEFPNI
ncbi:MULTISPECIES: LysR family transcriptional regulator [Gammaproteobacteria]|uniref:LysR family transcriptional regulator n=1 Tax=Gammaproteobacteria TaxID=1236 RepID=UPI000C610A82|nr:MULTISPECIES: LysR family transcriptional regulator [Gammaproteobacteria]MBN8241323.1 LysR family transcriptional regulator [Marinobacter nauticus]MBU73778.1 LysR family transcriptional regulator [Spongiibacter sp.]MBY6194621.1 LysR family transcriptional regulator [Marinobacter nauticus]MBY6215769.1 LysR family transcriptional regulator [Marinobacter nauticus]MCA0914172.1 LysR family transcriptional regulator [Marinobacter nauticus]|tara:strand:+ start:1859 stop:2755 length:897 start_codon:yes stop_codon:yes gene_type:complete